MELIHAYCTLRLVDKATGPITDHQTAMPKLENLGLTSSLDPCNAQSMNQIKPTNKMVIKRRLFLWAVG
ncbi:MAG: hypothetical protein JAY74_08255, partial [Candidatus Thiodiazotropha taylori]|nr:hypothetical protein [Candidatus Thiodiazotropha taylori]